MAALRISRYTPTHLRLVGGYFQSPDHPVVAGEWLHVLGEADGTNVQIFINAIPGEPQKYGGTIVPQAGDALQRCCHQSIPRLDRIELAPCALGFIFGLLKLEFERASMSYGGTGDENSERNSAVRRRA